MSTAPSKVEFRVWETETGRYVAVDEETGTRVEAEYKPVAMIGLVGKIERTPFLREFAESVYELEASEGPMYAKDLIEVFNDHGEMADLMSVVGTIAKQSQTQVDEPDKGAADAVQDLRGSLSGVTDKSATELVSDSRALDNERGERLTSE